MARLAETSLETLWFGDDDPNRSDAAAANSLAAAAARAADLRPFPAVAQRVMSLLAREDVDMKAVRSVIENDAGLAARLMRIANSPIYGCSTPAKSLEQAIFRLGMNEVQDVVAGIATLGMFRDSKGVGVRFRDHCAGVAAISRTIASLQKRRDVIDLFLCGLMHDIGKLLSMQVGEVNYRAMDRQLLREPDAMHLMERQQAGYDHASLGGHVLRLWNLPDEVAQVIAWHHQPGRAYERGGKLGTTVALIRLADAIEMRMQKSIEPDTNFIAELAGTRECAYLDITPYQIQRMWPTLVDAASEVVSAHFG